MTRALRPAAPVLAALVALPLGCAGSRPPAAPPAASVPAPAPAPPPPERPEPDPRQLATPVSAAHEEELRLETARALREADEILARLDDGPRRAASEAVASVEALLAESRAALAEAELDRAHNLARKALALAREL